MKVLQLCTRGTPPLHHHVIVWWHRELIRFALLSLLPFVLSSVLRFLSSYLCHFLFLLSPIFEPRPWELRLDLKSQGYWREKERQDSLRSIVTLFFNEDIGGEKSTTWYTGGTKKKGLEWPESWDKPRQKSFVNEVLGCWVYLLSQTRSSWVYLMSQFSTKTWVYLSSGLPFVPLPRQRYLRVKKKIAKNSI